MNTKISKMEKLELIESIINRSSAEHREKSPKNLFIFASKMDAFDIYNSHIQTVIQDKLASNKKYLKLEQQKLIQGTHIYQNSINVAVGKPQSGKSVALLTEIIKVTQLHPQTHLLIVVNKNGSDKDPTINLFKSEITVPIEFVARSEIEDYLSELIEYKELYNEIINQNLQEEQEDEQREDMFSILHINDFSRPYLHTLILLEDCGKSNLFKKGSYINSILVECRHIQCSFFITLQAWMMLDPEIKSYLGIVLVFPGFSREGIQYIIRQSNSNLSLDECMQRYQKLHTHQYMLIDCQTGSTIIN
jgi:hypothetical protein